jgi:hypothetical protein
MKGTLFSGKGIVGGDPRLRPTTVDWAFVGAAALFVFVFATTRLPIFLFYRSILLNKDSSGYFMIADQINKGFWPNLSIRTLGYPVFLKIVYLIFSTSSAVAMVQHGITLVSRLFFIWAMARAFPRRSLVPLAVSVALAAHAAISDQVLSDSSFMTDSLFVSFVVVTLGLLILGLARRKKALFIAASLSAAGTILVRPAGVFLVLILALTFVFMVRNRFGRGGIIAVALPCAVVLLMQMTYNSLTIGTFSLSAFSEHAMISLTSTFLEPDAAYGHTANRAIARCHSTFRQKHRRILDTSWNPVAIKSVFKKYYERNRVRIDHIFLSAEPADRYNLYLKWRPLWRRMAMDALRKHPVFALKYIGSSLYAVFWTNLGKQADLYRALHKNCLSFGQWLKIISLCGVPDSSFNRRFNTHEYSSTLTPSGFARSMLPELYDKEGLLRFADSLAPDPGNEPFARVFERLHQSLISVHSFVFRNPGWTLALLATWVFSMARLFRTRFRHRGAFTLFLLTSSALIYGIQVAVLAFPYLRYTYCLEFVYYMSPFLWPIALGPGDAPIESLGRGEEAISPEPPEDGKVSLSTET